MSDPAIITKPRRRALGRIDLVLFFMVGLVGWLWHRPTELPDAAISVLVGGAAFWFVLASPFSSRLRQHHSHLIAVVWFVASIIGLLWFMGTVIPYLHSLL